MTDIFDRIHQLVSCGLQPTTVIAITAMVLANKLEPSVNELAELAGLHRSEVDEVGIIIRTKRIGTYRSGHITLTDKTLLDLAAAIHDAKSNMAAKKKAK